MLTLYTTPVIYLYMERLGRRLARAGVRAGPAPRTPARARPAGAMSISEPFIRRPIATSLLAVAILLLGVSAYTSSRWRPCRGGPPHHLGQRQPAGREPGDDVLRGGHPARAALGRIAGLTDMTSTSSLGSTSITLQFDLDRDQAAGRDVQAAINAAAGDLRPTSLPAPTTGR